MSTADDHPALTPAQRRSLRISLTWVVIIVVTIVALQIPLPSVVTIGPTWLVPFIELIGIPIVGILFLAGRHDRLVTGTMTAFLAFLVLASVMNALLLLFSLVNGFTESGAALLFAGFAVLAVNVLSFGVVYWWIDSGGSHRSPDRQDQNTGLSLPPAGHGLDAGVAASASGLCVHGVHQHHRL